MFVSLLTAELSEQSTWAGPAPSIVYLGPEEGRPKKVSVDVCKVRPQYTHSQRVLVSLDFRLAKREAEINTKMVITSEKRSSIRNGWKVDELG